MNRVRDYLSVYIAELVAVGWVKENASSNRGLWPRIAIQCWEVFSLVNQF